MIQSLINTNQLVKAEGQHRECDGYESVDDCYQH